MSPLPDRPSLRQLRIQAKELRRALAEGDPVAIDRVLKAHPKYAGRPASRLEGRDLTLRDAQVTVAREHGFDSWIELLTEFEGEQVERWDERHYEGALGRAFKEAQMLNHRTTTIEHLLLAVLSAPEKTIARTALESLGITHAHFLESIKSRLRGLESEEKATSTTPAYQTMSGFAQGIALGMNSAQVTDEHVLLAIIYMDTAYGARLIGPQAEVDEVVEALAAGGFPVPRFAPPLPTSPTGPFGPQVYFPAERWSAVTQAIIKEFPPGTAMWGTNRSDWKEGFWYVHGEDEIPMEQLVRSAVADRDSVIVVDHVEAWRLEEEARDSQSENEQRPLFG